MSSKKFWLSVLFFLGGFVLLNFVSSSPTVLAAVSADGWNPDALKVTGLSGRSFFSILLSVVNFAITFIGILAVIIFIYGGVIYLISSGENDKIEQAKKIIQYAIIGIVVSVLGFVAVKTVDSIIKGGGGDAAPAGGETLASPTEGPGQDGSMPARQVQPGEGGNYVPGSGGGRAALPISPEMMN